MFICLTILKKREKEKDYYKKQTLENVKPYFRRNISWIKK